MLFIESLMYVSLEDIDFKPPCCEIHLSLTEVAATSKASPNFKLCVPRADWSITYEDQSALGTHDWSITP